MIWASWLFLLASLWGAWFAINAVVPRRRGAYLATWSWIAGWLAGDLAFHHIAWQALATGLFVFFGALEALPGQIGLAVTGISWLALGFTQLRSSKGARVCEEALRDTFSDDSGAASSQAAVARWARTSDRQKFQRLSSAIPRLPKDVELIRNVRYARARGLDLHLDVYRPRARELECPVLLQIHGGAWFLGSKDHQALPLMHHLSSNGWVCVSLNYRLSPHATFPDHLIDTKRALAWIREHIGEFGGDPDFIVTTGGSAGGQLCALTGLTANDPDYQPGFEHVDTRVQACIPFYGVYDFSGATEEHDGLEGLLERYVMKGSRHEIPKTYQRASPLHLVDDKAPPFFVLHGDCDSLVPVAQARAFVRQLRARSLAPVAYAELPGAQHMFEVFHTLRTPAVLQAVEGFATTLYRRYLAEGPDRKRDPTIAASRRRLRAV